MRCKPLSLVASLVVSACLGGCAASADRYPSLAIRDIERVSGTFDVDPASAEPPPALPASELDTIPGLVATAQSAHQRFIAAAPSARRQVAAAIGANVNDNSWASAQVALADLESLRSQAAIPLGDLDRLNAEAAITFADSQAVDQARAEVLTMIEEEDQVLAELRGRLTR